MARKFRIDRDDKVDLKRTQSSFSDDPVLNKAKQISRKNDDVKNLSVGIYDIDLAFKDFLERDVKPTIVEDGKFIPVPVLYASPENWVSAQKQGYIRDSNGKIITPLITFKRNSLDVNTDLAKLKVLTDDDTSRAFERILDNGKLGEIYNIGCDEGMEYSILDIAKLVQKQQQESLYKNQGLKHQFEGSLPHLPGGMRRPRGGLQEG